jgi:hypothetical protein
MAIHGNICGSKRSNYCLVVAKPLLEKLEKIDLCALNNTNKNIIILYHFNQIESKLILNYITCNHINRFIY